MLNAKKTTLFCILYIGVMAAATFSSQAKEVFPALKRSALSVKAPERQFFMSAAEAGKRIVAVGERGVIAISENGGETWAQARSVPVSITLTAVHFVDDKLGWAVGHGGVILHTIDGGNNWTQQANGEELAKQAFSSAEELVRANPFDKAAERALKSAQFLVSDGPDKPLLDVYFKDANHGWVVGAYNLFFETVDGGKTWVSMRHLIENPKEMHLYSIRSNRTDIYILGEQGQMHRSTDGGKKFSPLKSPYAGSWFALAIGSNGNLIAGGLRGNLFRSNNRGEKWTKVEFPFPISFVSASALSNGDFIVVNQAGQVFNLSTDSKLRLITTASMSPIASALPLKTGGVLLVGGGGLSPVKDTSSEQGKSK
jgi:photosystem II stability/assembly factor-like uncharacterized protein